nr:formin-like protein 3 [Aegilops tauschii subsp. strangulata]
MPIQLAFELQAPAAADAATSGRVPLRPPRAAPGLLCMWSRVHARPSPSPTIREHPPPQPSPALQPSLLRPLASAASDSAASGHSRPPARCPGRLPHARLGRPAAPGFPPAPRPLTPGPAWPPPPHARIVLSEPPSPPVSSASRAPGQHRLHVSPLRLPRLRARRLRRAACSASPPRSPAAPDPAAPAAVAPCRPLSPSVRWLPAGFAHSHASPSPPRRACRVAAAARSCNGRLRAPPAAGCFMPASPLAACRACRRHLSRTPGHLAPARVDRADPTACCHRVPRLASAGRQ